MLPRDRRRTSVSSGIACLALCATACASSAATINAPLAPPANAADEPRSFLGCWRPRSPTGPLDGVQMLCFERDRYFIFLIADWDAARVVFEAMSATSWRIERVAAHEHEMTIALVDGGLSFTVGSERAMLERLPPGEQRLALDRVAKLPTIESLCDRARRCIDAAGARLPEEEDDSDRVLASTCIHDVDDVVELLRQRGSEVPPECTTR